MNLFKHIFRNKDVLSNDNQTASKIIKSPIILNTSKIIAAPRIQRAKSASKVSLKTISLATSDSYPQDPHAHFLFLEAAKKGTAELGGVFYSIKGLKEIKNINSKDRRGYTPLQDAASQGLYAAVEELLQAGADVNAVTSDHVTALHLAKINGHNKVVEELLEYGAKNNEGTLEEDFFN